MGVGGLRAGHGGQCWLAVHLGDHRGGELALVPEKRVGGATDTDLVVPVGVVGEDPPLGTDVDVVVVDDEGAFGADRVASGAVQHRLGEGLALLAEEIGVHSGGRLRDLRPQGEVSFPAL